MAEFLQCLQARLGTVGIFIARIALDQVLVGLCGIHIQRLPLQALPTQQRDFRVDERPGAAGTIDLGQLQHYPLAITPVISAVGIVEMVVHGPAGTPDGTGREG